MQVYSHKLSNGLTILVVPRHNIPKVSIQLWYNVGSKDEKTNEKGIAHLIEHMIFKGTSTLSECDINLITHKLSGYCNAYTSYDYTGYIFDLPSQHWWQALTIMSDCMSNALFKQEFLNSELKAVIQELKMYKDDYASSLIESMLGSVFNGHPYQYPIIGYKQDLWNLERKTLVDFYKKHYIPNNATLVVVGDVEPQDVFNRTKDAFGNIKPNFDYKKEEFYLSPDLRTNSVTLYRDIQQPIIILSWTVPGVKDQQSYLNDILAWLVGFGKGSRLYKILVDELQLLTDIECFVYDLFEKGLFFIYLKPKDITNLETIIKIIKAELKNLSEHGPSEQDLKRAMNKSTVADLTELENNQKLAYSLGKYFLATGNKDYIFEHTKFAEYNLENVERVTEDIKIYIKEYLKPYLMDVGKVLPLEESQKDYSLKLQEISDQEDVRILEGKVRTCDLEPGRCVHTMEAQAPKDFKFPQARKLVLSNGLKVLYHYNPQLPKVSLILDFKVKHYYDPKGLEGLCNFTADMMVEGTKNHSAKEFTQELESYGMFLLSEPGRINMSMLSKDLKKGLELLKDVISSALFDEKEIEKVREHIFADIIELWDEPSKFTTLLAEEAVYKDHPYSKNGLGTQESITRITREDLIKFYQYYSNPRDARLVIVGDLENYDLETILEQVFGSWKQQDLPKILLPEIDPVKSREINYPINRDQVVLCFAGLSVKRNNPDFDKLLIFEQIFTGGVLGSMSSRLFDLREQSGLFYTIGGSLLYKVDKQPGMILIKTIVSQDKVIEAEQAIKNIINTAAFSITEDEFKEAKQAIINSFVDHFASNSRIASTFLFLDKHDLPQDYFSYRPQQLKDITKNEMQEVAQKYLNTKKIVIIRAGRIS